MRTQRTQLWLIVLMLAPVLAGCQPAGEGTPDTMSMKERLDQYTTFRLAADLSDLSDNQREMLPLLILAGEAMNEIFWLQAWGD